MMRSSLSLTLVVLVQLGFGASAHAAARRAGLLGARSRWSSQHSREPSF